MVNGRLEVGDPVKHKLADFKGFVEQIDGEFLTVRLINDSTITHVIFPEKEWYYDHYNIWKEEFSIICTRILKLLDEYPEGFTL